VKLLLLQIDKTQEIYLEQGIGVYQKRVSNYTRFEIVTINVPKNVRQRSVDEQKEAEGKLILAACQSGDQLVLLDEQGVRMTSRAFAKFIESKQGASVKRLVFATGGPFGFSKAVYEKADLKLSLSDMTFSHQLVRLFFVEQLYRAFTILKGEKYHHD
jgi:23S rRNA (pseudouridine1915-N3)-methyltransferase